MRHQLPGSARSCPASPAPSRPASPARSRAASFRLARPGIAAAALAIGLLTALATPALATSELAAGATASIGSPAPAARTGGTAGSRPAAASWVGTWAASPQQARPADLTGAGDPTVTGFDDQTVREIVHVSIGGTAVRIHLSNAFSQQEL